MKNLTNKKIFFCKCLLLLALPLITSCQPKSKKLSKQEIQFCENYFIALQCTKERGYSLNYYFQYIEDVLNRLREKGNTDIKHVYTLDLSSYSFYTLTNYYQNGEINLSQNSVLNEENKNRIKNKAKQIEQISEELLGFNVYKLENKEEANKYITTLCMLYSKDCKWEMPELKANFIEQLDNGSQIWQIQDFKIMEQVRLIKNKNGELNINNVEKFSTK